MRKGFTLLELMTAGAIFTLVIAGVGSALIGIVNLSRTAMYEAELSVRMRELRDKLLFRAAPMRGRVVYSGLLSGAAPSGSGYGLGGGKITVAAGGFDTLTGGAVDQRVELVRHSGEDWFLNDGESPRHEKWLHPGGIRVLPESGVIEDKSNYSGGASFNCYAINLESRIDVTASSRSVVRRERIVVPVFGAEQKLSSKGVFNDD